MRATVKFVSAVVGAGIALSMGLAQAHGSLASEAKINQATARTTALAKVPDGIVKSSELESENGLLIWSFDIAKPHTASITEVRVNAIDGKIASVTTETPRAQANEAKADHG